MHARWLPLAAFVALTAFSFGCGGKTVTRIDPTEQTDLSGKWNDTDSRLVADALIADCLSRPWLSRHLSDPSSSERPVLVVGPIRNKSLEHIPVDTFIKDMERAFITDGRIRVVADAGERVDIRAEREAMINNASAASIKEFGRELGADYVMMGQIDQIIDQEDGETVSFYQTGLELINAETNEKVWIGDHKIKKFIAQGRYSK